MVRVTNCPNMMSAVYCGHKATNQTNIAAGTCQNLVLNSYAYDNIIKRIMY